MRHWKDDPRWAYVFVNIATLLWGTNVVLGRFLRNDVGAFTLTAARFTVAGLIFVALAHRIPPGERRLGRQWPLLVVMGLTGVFGFNSLLYTSLKSTTAANAALINGTGPLIFSLMAALTLRERLTARNLAGALVSLAGVVIIISGGSLDALLGLRFNLGDLLVLAAVVVWGVYSMLGRLVTRTRSAFAATALSNWIGLAMLYPAAIVEQARQPAAPGWLVILAAVYIGVGPSFVSFLAWNEGVRRVGATRATVFYNMLPFYGTLLGVLILHEPLGWAQVIGGALILAGSLISVWPDLWSSH